MEWMFDLKGDTALVTGAGRGVRTKCLPHHLSKRLLYLGAIVLALGGCTLQPAYVPPDRPDPPGWSAGVADLAPNPDGKWWSALRDPAIDALVPDAYRDSQTVAQAVARIDEARAAVGANAAQRVPTVAASASLNRSRTTNTLMQASDPTVLNTTAAAGPNIRWEVDLFGRMRHALDAAQNRLDARTADAAAARLSLAADIAGGILALRACRNTERVLVDEIASREKTLVLTRRRLAAGFAAPVDEARSIAGIAGTRTNLAARREQCDRQTNALVALSGMDAAAVNELLGRPSGAGATDVGAGDSRPFMPQAPAVASRLPARILMSHPAIVSAERETAAAWSEIGVARAKRLPRLDLGALLTGQWLRIAGSDLGYTTWSIGSDLSGILFDGGAGAAGVDAAEARYRHALASFQNALRTIVQEVENALAAQASATARAASADQALAAARTVLEISEARWQAGAVSMFELEDSRRQFSATQDAAITAGRDQGVAWVALVKATGGAINLSQE